MEIVESPLTLEEKRSKIITVQGEAGANDRKIITRTPVFMYDALGTIVTIVDPLKPLKSKEELALYTLSSLKAFNPQNEEVLSRTIHELQMDDIAEEIRKNLLSRELPPISVFYALIDIITEKYCEKIGDKNQETRIDVLLRTHSLASPGIFDSVNEYSHRTFHSDISQLILTQDNQIMREVYEQMLKRYGYHLDVIAVPDKRFDKLRKNNPELYSKLAAFFSRETNEMGLYDDTEKNLVAAKEAGVLTQLASGINNNDSSIIKSETSKLVRLLFGEPEKEVDERI